MKIFLNVSVHVFASNHNVTTLSTSKKFINSLNSLLYIAKLFEFIINPFSSIEFERLSNKYFTNSTRKFFVGMVPINNSINILNNSMLFSLNSLK